MSSYIQNLIEQGEHQQLDFKFEIADSKKIARSLVAFANTDGGKLLVGVKDNGAIAGVRSDEEYHMVEAAAQLYCQPEVEFTTREWTINGKVVLEVSVPKSKSIKHKAPDKNNLYKVYVRVDDKNLLANYILLQVWKKQQLNIPVRLAFTENVSCLLQYMEKNGSITRNASAKHCNMSQKKADALLIKLISLGIIQMTMTEKGTTYTLSTLDYMDLLHEANPDNNHYM